MMRTSMVKKTKAGLVRSRAGNVAPIFALAMCILAPLSALAVDGVHVWSAKHNLQDSLDAALLAVARANPTSQAEIDAIAAGYLKNNLTDRHGGVLQSITVTRVADGEYTGSARLRVPTVLAGVLGVKTMDAGVDGRVVVGKGDVDVVLALDTTGSMAGSRIAALRDAARDFVKDMVKTADTRVGVVPFARHVNIGMKNRNAPGFDIPKDSRTCRMERVQRHVNYRNCQQIVHNNTCWNDGTPYPCSWTENRCDYDVIEVDEEVCNEQKWHGCVSLRHTPLHQEDDASSNKIAGVMNTSCGKEIEPLTDKQGPLISTISSMQVGDETFLPGGLSMSWAVLSHRVPFTQGVNPTANRDTMRAIVLMSDGLNTVSKHPWDVGHWGSNSNEANTMTDEICDAIKADNVLIFTVAFEVTNPTALGVLRDCATAPSFAYNAQNANALKDAFNQIGATLSRLRLSQ